MANSAQQAEQHIGETKGVSNCVHDLIHDLSIRLDAVWRYDQNKANAEKAGNKEASQLWADMKQADMKNIERIKSLLAKGLSDSGSQQKQ